MFQTDDKQALRADLADGGFNVAAHQRAGQDEGAGARQAGDGADGVGEGLLADERGWCRPRCARRECCGDRLR